MSLQFKVIISESKMQDSYFGTENDSTFRLVNLFEEDGDLHDDFNSEDYEKTKQHLQAFRTKYASFFGPGM